jgi:hypothetical protein
MAKKSFSDFHHRKLGEDELRKMVETNLDTLQQLVRVYDAGYSIIAFAMATEIQKILGENAWTVKLRGRLRFGSTVPDQGRSQLNAFHPLVGARVGGVDPEVTYLPTFMMPDREGQPVRALEFRIWWNREVVYRASAAVPGTLPRGAIPVNDTPVHPFDDRTSLTRRQVIGMLRDKLGAHQDDELPSVLDDLQDGLDIGFGVRMPDGSERNTFDGSLKIAVPPLPAMVRQIAHEVLVAYGRHDPPPPDSEGPTKSSASASVLSGSGT